MHDIVSPPFLISPDDLDRSDSTEPLPSMTDRFLRAIPNEGSADHRDGKTTGISACSRRTQQERTEVPRYDDPHSRRARRAHR